MHNDKGKRQNALVHASSPYLRQHADNPVNWVEWSTAAFEEAKKRNVPVLISIGYSTCHWCHVMAHESFEDQATADIMNELYVCIKVDREEHPEVDEIYMDAVQALTGRGGWPLHAIVDHDGRPFFAGTYYPREQWQQVLNQLSTVWKTDRARIDRAAAEITKHLQEMNQRSVTAMAEDIWQRLAAQANNNYDDDNPGFGHPQPKFPSSQLLPLLLSVPHEEFGNLHDRAELVLEAMQDGGIHDRVGGGFHRYSVDAEWRLPHFEKMLYDNAQLMGVYAFAAVRCKRPDFMQTSKNIAAYLERDMRVLNQAGDFLGYASAEDADDPGGEGSFYAWSPAELKKVLSEAEATELIASWNVSPGTAHKGRGGNFEPVVSHIPHPRAGPEQKPAALQQQREQWETYYPTLRKHRDQRARPGRDDKVLTDLNALTLRGLSLLARYSGEDYDQQLAALIDVLSRRMTENGLERTEDTPAFITDYGFLALALTDAFVITGDPRLIQLAERIGQEAFDRLRAEDGGFYTTPAGRTDLVRRSREDHDGAYPAGVHCLAWAYVRLGHLTGKQQWLDAANGIFGVQAQMTERAPTACSTLLSAYAEFQAGPRIAVLSGDVNDELYQSLRRVFLRDAPVGVQLIELSQCQKLNWPALEGRKDLKQTQILICVGEQCLLPINDVKSLKAQLQDL